MSCDRERLAITLGRTELARLVQRLRLRLERGQPLTGTIALPNASSAERDAVVRLMGRVPSRGAAVGVRLEQLEERLRSAGVSPTLRAAVEELTGPVVDRKAQRTAAEQEWNELFATASKRINHRTELEPWLVHVRATGLLRRQGIGAARRLLAQALDVLDTLPTSSDVTLAELGASVLGDAHALDPDTSLCSLVMRAASLLARSPAPSDANSRRDVWAAVGVICDELSGPVLLLNLRALGETHTARALNIYAEAGEPTCLTTRQLRGSTLKFCSEHTGSRVYVCENPSVLAAAARSLGARSNPLICIEGQPRTATRMLLNQIGAAGIQLWYHGDFDWPGIQIANMIMARHKALPWRMGEADYRAAARGSLSLAGAPVPASWDENLTSAMRDMGLAVHEEQVTESLLKDLGQ